MKNFIYKLFSIFNSNKQIPPIKTIRTLDLLDTVWVKDGDILYKGWVFDISRRHITVVYGNCFDYKFRINKQTDTIEQGEKTLYCNKPDELSE